MVSIEVNDSVSVVCSKSYHPSCWFVVTDQPELDN